MLRLVMLGDGVKIQVCVGWCTGALPCPAVPAAPWRRGGRRLVMGRGGCRDGSYIDFSGDRHSPAENLRRLFPALREIGRCGSRRATVGRGARAEGRKERCNEHW
ncbi:hypothetical protein O3P69_020651 [Scylla paramamosain]|uniref:Secreted protein n=1 Tax=Scylla paramamosain TaxID=85552 RepID=A0AAW0TN18_SCYPA